MTDISKISELEAIIHSYTVIFVIFDVTFFAMLLLGLGLLIRYLKSKKKLHDSNEYLLYTIRGQEKERSRIARELHDTVAQDLRYCKSLSEKNDAAQNIKQITGLLEKSLTEIRFISYNLAPSDIVKNDFRKNIINLCNYMTGMSEIKIKLSILENTDFSFLDENDILNLYRIIQEAIFNVIKHAKASEVVILIRSETGEEKKGLYIFISDDGTGFNTTQTFHNTEKHFGIIGMKKRSQLIGADFSIFSNSGEGTQISIYKPKKNKNNNLLYGGGSRWLVKIFLWLKTIHSQTEESVNS